MAYIDLECVDTDDLLEELAARGYGDADSKDERLNQLYELMRNNKQEEAWNLMRTYVCDKTGRVL